MDWEIVIIVLITALVTIIIPTIFELRKNLKKISILVDNINDELPTILKNINQISEDASSATNKLNIAVGEIVEIEKKISDEIKQPLIETAATLGGFMQALQTFVTYFIRKK